MQAILKKYSLKEWIFFIAYGLFWISFFLNDVEQETMSFGRAASLLRYASFLVAGAGLFTFIKQRQKAVAFGIVVAVCFFTYLTSGHSYFVGLALLSYYAWQLEDKKIIKLSLVLMLVGMVLVPALSAVGILENLNTPRSSAGGVRYSLGFYHSNVLPLLCMYVISYIVLLKNKKKDTKWLIALAAVALVAYVLCDSKNAILCSVLLLAAGAANIYFPNKISPLKAPLRFGAQYGVPFFSLLSVVVPYYLNEVKLFQFLDMLVTYRFGLVRRVINRVGLHWLAMMSNQEYSRATYVVDNAYALIAVRYGLLYLLPICLFVYRIIRKYYKNFAVMAVTVVLIFANFIDNDVLDYSCLPFILIGMKYAVYQRWPNRKEYAPAEKPLVSVIMSTYNETEDELKKSIQSILQQTYTNFEFIIVNDNPDNVMLQNVLTSIQDERVRIICNEQNIGLVNSLNRALQVAGGEYIARMDADDISLPTRLQNELGYLLEHNLDMVGCFIEPIDGNDKPIRTVMRFPAEHERIKWYMRWGSCLAHPAWLVKKTVYDQLHGYRHAMHCEDYDFVLRAIACGFQTGNLPQIELRYRIRQTGVSVSNKEEQYLLRDKLARDRKTINAITEDDMAFFLLSDRYEQQKAQYLAYKQARTTIKSGGLADKCKAAVRVLGNVYLWKALMEKVMLLAREH